MARKKSNDNAGAIGLLFFAALATLITFVSAIYGVVVLVAWHYNTRKSNKIPEALSDGYFIPTREESRQLAAVEKELADERKSIANYESQGRGLSRRADGAFDERSSLGKRLNSELASSRSNESRLVFEHAELKNFSYQRLSHYLDIKVGAASWQKAGVAYVTAILFFMIHTPVWVVMLNEFLSKSGFFGQLSSMPMLWGILAAAALISLAIQLVSRLYYKHVLERELSQGATPEKHVAVVYTEMLAIQSGIGRYESDDLDRAEAIFKAREGIEPAPELADVTPVMSPPLPAPVSKNATQTIDVTPSVDLKTTDVVPPSPPTNVKKRALWKRLITAVGFGALGLLFGLLAFGLLGQGDFGTALILIFPLIGLVWGFQFRKHIHVSPNT